MANELLVFYDGYCPLCRNSKKAIEKTDWFNKISFLSFREPGVIDHYHLNEKRPEERICSIRLRDEATFEGIETILQIAVRLPLYWIFVPFLYMAIGFGLGQPAYDFIAKRRKIVPVGQCDENGCPVHTDRE
ncbi:MAG TPA: DUF393 domain-containing protein [Bacillales bacterium]|nr:DUF393 domain-containing protein [Bacillales bacterium]